MTTSQTSNRLKQRFFTLLGMLTIILVASQALVLLLNRLDQNSAPEFTSALFLFSQHVILIVFSIITVLPLLRISSAPPTKTVSKPWLGFLLIFTFVSVFNILIDPSGQTSLSLFPPLGDTSRIIKSEYYSNLPETPTLVILGSSRTFTLSPQYIYDTLGYETFNFGNANYSIDELPTQLRFIDGKSNDFPEVLLLEILPIFHHNIQPEIELTHFRMIPYMVSLKATNFVISKTSQYLSLQTFTETVYSLQFAIKNPDHIPMWTFQSDGYGILNNPSADSEEFEKIIQSKNIVPACPNFSYNVIKTLEEIMQFAFDHKTAVIIYNSPLQPDFFANFLTINPNYSRCQQIFMNLIISLQQAYPNLFYLDFTSIESINGLRGQQGFYDYEHLTAQNSNLLIDAAANTINEAYTYAINARAETP